MKGHVFLTAFELELVDKHTMHCSALPFFVLPLQPIPAIDPRYGTRFHLRHQVHTIKVGRLNQIEAFQRSIKVKLCDFKNKVMVLQFRNDGKGHEKFPNFIKITYFLEVMVISSINAFHVGFTDLICTDTQDIRSTSLITSIYVRVDIFKAMTEKASRS